MLTKFIFVLYSLVLPYCSTSTYAGLELTKEQLQLAYDILQLEQDITLVAIAYKESRLGQVSINLSDPSCGVFHTHLRFLLKSKNISYTLVNKNHICSKLLNLSYSVEKTKEILTYFSNYYKGNELKYLQAYNSGFNLYTYTYAYDIINIRNKLKNTLHIRNIQWLQLIMENQLK